MSPVIGEKLIYEETLNETENVGKVNSEGIESVEPVSLDGNITLRIYKINKTFEYLEEFNSYRIASNSNRKTHLTINFQEKGISGWLDQIDSHFTHLILLSYPGGKERPFETNGTYRGNLSYVGKEVEISVANWQTSEQLENFQLAINPSRTQCGRYLRVNSSFRRVDSCEEFEGNSGSKILNNLNQVYLVLLTVLILFLSYLLTIKFKDFYFKDQTKVNKVKIKTNQIIEKMKNGELEKNQEILNKLDKANEEALEGNEEKALKTLDRIENRRCNS